MGDEDWTAKLDAGDDALRRHQVDAAEQIYDELSIELEPSDSASDLLVKAAVTHRLGIVKYLAGEIDVAERFFAAVAELTDTVARTAHSGRQVSSARSLADQSRRHRQRVVASTARQRTVEGTIELTEDVAMLVAVCQHGCPSIVIPCDFDAPHC